MAILTEYVSTKFINSNKDWLISKGYKYTGYRSEVLVKVNDLQPNSTARIKYSCDICGDVKEGCYNDLHKRLQNKGKIICVHCNSRFNVTKLNSTISKTSPLLLSMLVDKNDADLYTLESVNKIKFKCLDCSKEFISTPKSVSKSRGNVCPFCNDGFSFNNKFVANILKELNIEFKQEYYDKLWCYYLDSKNVRHIVKYDFYIPSKNIILELDGGFHYYSIYRDVSESKEIDKIKDNLAKKHGIKLCRINCSNFYSVDTDIINGLTDIFNEYNFSKLNIGKLIEVSKRSESAKIWDLFNKGFTRNEIAEQLKISVSYVKTTVAKGKKYGIVHYESKEDVIKNRIAKVKKIFDSGIYDLTKIKEVIGEEHESIIRQDLKRLYQITKDPFYKLTMNKNYYMNEDNEEIYSLSFLADKYQQKRNGLSATLWKYIKNKRRYKGCYWKVYSRQEAYKLQRDKNVIIYEMEVI